MAESVYQWTTGWTAEKSGFDLRLVQEIHLSSTASRAALGPTQSPIQWLMGALSLGIKRLGREVDHSPPSSAEIKNEWSYTYTSPYVLWCLIKLRDNFTFTLIRTIKRVGLSSPMCIYCEMTAEAGIVERIDGTIARQRRCIYVSATTDTDTTVGDAVFSVWSVTRLHNEDQLDKLET
jgi:hypothetical protein